ncbi:mutS2 [Symbiodinium pilosum]|uniref:MutS2 protein n=1 Tax=Symbiodinium pilosum TaxID=2952 RepID=A0A812T9W0_SYMPI|nr:mutS2 [Symbiodinium pilosum]
MAQVHGCASKFQPALASSQAPHQLLRRVESSPGPGHSRYCSVVRSKWTAALLAPAVFRAIKRRCSRQSCGRQPCRTSLAAAQYGDEFVGDAVDVELADSLKQRTLESLDLDYVLEKLQALCYTAMAAEMAVNPEELMADTPEEARALYATVLELTQLEDADLDLEEKLDILEEVEQCTRGAVLENPSLCKVSRSIEALLRLRNGLEAASVRGVQIPSLMALCQDIELPDRLLDAILEAFDEDGELSVKKFPELAELRQKVKDLEDSCTRVMSEVTTSGKYSAYLDHDGYMQFGGYYVLLVKPRHAEKVGRIFDSTRSGRTVYVEPHEVVPITDELLDRQKELKLLVRRILGTMSLALSHSADDIRRCLKAAARIDLARARLFLGEDMEGEVPKVGDDGIIDVKQARNPCLILRGGKRVVGYRLELGKFSQGLLLTGPNAGGKTVVLKTMGLLALLARCGIPVPAGESPRVDFFEVVLADVGDMQTIVDDLSTYSAHLVASRIMLSSVQHVGPRAMVLVDEAGTGTDPQQGAALARAMLEAFLDSGARIVATTHCVQLKNWATEDDRTMTAAMEYKSGRPTYRLATNMVGESHAMETAQRLGLPGSLVARAVELLGDDQRQLIALQRKAADAEKDFESARVDAEQREAAARTAIAEANAKEAELARREVEVADMEAKLQARTSALQRQMQAELQAQMAVKERQFQDVVQRLKLETQKLGSRFRIVGDVLEDLKVEVDQEAEAKYQAQNHLQPAVPGAMAANHLLSPGDWVEVLAAPPWRGLKGQVERIHLANGAAPRVSVRLGANGKVKEFLKTELGRTSKPQGARKIAKPKGEAAEPTRDYSAMAF